MRRTKKGRTGSEAVGIWHYCAMHKCEKVIQMEKINLDLLRKLSLLLLVGVFFGESYGRLVPSGVDDRNTRQIRKASAFIGEKRPQLTLKEREKLAILIENAALDLKLPNRRNGKSWDKLGFLLGVIQTESRFHRKAKSYKGALGLMQVMPDTAKWLAEKEGISFKSASELYEPELNLHLGVLYLNYLIERTDSIEAALLSYNAGLGGYKRFGGIPSYSKSILQNYEEFQSFTWDETRYESRIAGLFEF